MGEILSIVAIAILLGLIIVSVRIQRAGLRETRADEETRTAGGDEQRQRSIRRRAEAKAAAPPHHT